MGDHYKITGGFVPTSKFFQSQNSVQIVHNASKFLTSLDKTIIVVLTKVPCVYITTCMQKDHISTYNLIAKCQYNCMRNVLWRKYTHHTFTPVIKHH